MSLRACPQCRRESFTWSRHDEPRDETRWHCVRCGYSAVEDEALESGCPSCGRPGARIFLTDDDGSYRYCPWCRARFLARDEA